MSVPIVIAMQQANTSQQPDTSAQQQPDLPEVGFLVAAFTDENAADQALDAMKQARKQRQFYWEVAAVIRQDVQGKVHYHETGDMSAGKGAGIGALVGGVIGILAGPAGVVAGAGVGAGGADHVLVHQFCRPVHPQGLPGSPEASRRDERRHGGIHQW